MTRVLVLIALTLGGSACAAHHPAVAIPVPVVLTLHDGLIILPPFLTDQVKVCLAERFYQHPDRTVLVCTDVGAVRRLARTALALDNPDIR